MQEWIRENPATFWMVVASVAMIVGSMIAVPIVVVKLPADFLTRDEKKKSGNLALRIAKNVLGWLLIAAGVAMLVLPGQGILVLVLGLVLVDLPGKQKVIRWMMSRPKVIGAANRLRKRFGKPPLEKPKG
jgi:hypothetical protein